MPILEQMATTIGSIRNQIHQGNFLGNWQGESYWFGRGLDQAMMVKLLISKRSSDSFNARVHYMTFHFHALGI